MVCTHEKAGGGIKVFKFKAPPPPPPPKPAVTFNKTEKGLTIDLNEVPATEVARYFSDSAGINVLVDANVDKTVTAKLVNLEPERAVKALFESRGMAVSMSDGIYHVSRGGWGEDNSAANSKLSQMKRLSIMIRDSLVSLEVENAPLDQLIRTIAIQSNLNIVIYDRLTGEISAKFDSIPVDDALRFLLQNTKFTFWKEKNDLFRRFQRNEPAENNRTHSAQTSDGG